MNDDPTTPDDPPAYEEPPALFARHFMTCRTLWFDHRQPEMGYSLGGVHTVIEPAEGLSFPLRLERVFVYAQLWGDEAEHRLRVRIVKLESIDDEECEIQLGLNGEPREFPMPSTRLVPVTALEYVNQIAFPIGPVGFRVPGRYEYQLWADGIEEPVAREQVLLQE